MKLIRELLEARSRYGDPGESKHEMIYKWYDGLIDVGMDIFDIKIKYTLIDHGIERHPYGMGYADEDMGLATEIDSAVTTTEVKQFDEDGENVIKVWPKGTDVEKLPGWNDDRWKDLKLAVNKDR